jgi:DNA repair exonuclease SbcCD nuclease subunit
MSGVRLLHTGDVHLGAAFGFLGRKGREQRRQLQKTFSRVIDLALTSQVDVVLIAGDLFDSAFPAPETVGEVAFQLGRLEKEGIWTFIAPGTHDRMQPAGVYESRDLQDLEHLHVFKTTRLEPFDLASLGLSVYGRATAGGGQDVLKDFRAADDAKWKVGLLHASFLIPGKVERDEMMVSAESIAASNLDYLALGHWHAMADYSQGPVKAFYSGPPEPLETGKGNEGMVLLVELEEGAEARVNPVSTGRRRMLRLQIDAGQLSGPSSLYTYLRQLADPELALEARVIGLFGDEWADFDWDKMEDEIAALFFSFRLEALPAGVSSYEVEAYPEKTVVGKFLRLAQKEIAARDGEDASIAEEAVRLGMAHLFKRY